MRKKISLALVLLLIVILALALAACNPKAANKDELPDKVGPSAPGTVDPVDGTLGLKFYFNKPNSIFKSIELDTFDLSKDIEYAITTTSAKGGESESERKPLTLDLVDEECRPLLSREGHHTIRVTVPVEDEEVKGAFTLHLMSNAGVTQFVNLTFMLGPVSDGVIASFGTTTTFDGEMRVVVQVAKDAYINSWQEFVSTFPMRRATYALMGFCTTPPTDDVTPTLSSEVGFPYKTSNDAVLYPVWDHDVITVHFDLNLPTGANFSTDGEGYVVDVNGRRVLDASGEGIQDPKAYFAETLGEQSVQKRYGRVLKPDTPILGVFNGLSFGGWYTATEGDAGEIVLDKAWNFNTTVGETDVYLYAKWNEKSYSFVLHTTGGELSDNLPAIGGVPTGTELVCTANYLLSGALSSITFSGFKFNVPLSSYYVRINVGDGSEKLVMFSDFYENLSTSNTLVKGDYFKPVGVFEDYACKTPVEFATDESGATYMRQNSEAYVRWEFNMPSEDEPDHEELYLDRISRYFTERVFKGEGVGYSFKADGTIKILQCTDEDVTQLIIPAEVRIGDRTYQVTEIGDNACDNMLAANVLDLSHATNLTRIGERAFAYCVALDDVIATDDSGVSTVPNLEYVGSEAFGDTPFENNYAENHRGRVFIILNDILYKFVGEVSDGKLDMTGDGGGYYTAENVDMEGVEESLRQALLIQYNGQLESVKSIMQGAFSEASGLETLTLVSSVETIENGAFKNLKSLKGIVAKDGANLSYVGENAFDDDAAILGTQSDNKQGTASIVIGSVYYRLTNKSMTSIELPASIRYIAPYAFKGCSNLRTISFSAPENIQVIGKYAFIDTKYIQIESGDTDSNTYVKDGYAVVNGMLVSYYDTSERDAALPNYGEVSINEYAFTRHSSFLTSLRLGANVKRIANYAFYESRSLKTLIFNEIDVNEDGTALVNAPDIDNYSFANASGAFIDGLNVFVRSSVIEFFEALASNEKQTEDETTRKWFDLYLANEGSFHVENITSVTINGEVIADVLLHTGVSGKDAFFDRYAEDKGGEFVFSLENALYIMSNTGVGRYEALSSDMDFEFVKIEEEEVGAGARYFLRFTYQGVNYTTGLAGDGDGLEAADRATQAATFIITVYDAVKEGESYQKFNSSVDEKYGTTADPYKVETTPKNEFATFENIESDSGTFGTSEEFVYWNTHGTFDLAFSYTDISGVKREIKNDIDEAGNITLRRIRIYSEAGRELASLPRDTGSLNARTHTVTLRVDFYGLGTFDYTFTYTVQKPLYNELRQVRSVSLPLNTDGALALQSEQNVGAIEVVRQNGVSVPLTLRNQGSLRFDASLVDTSSVGMHTIRVYFNNAEVNNSAAMLELNFTYIVTLEADPSLFEYDIRYFDDETVDSYGNTVEGEALIVGIKPEMQAAMRRATTLVLPSVYTVTEGSGDALVEHKFSVTSIGMSSSGAGSTSKGVFEGLTNLRSVYLSANLEYIYYNSFKDCTNLKDIYTAQRSMAEGMPFNASYDVVRESVDFDGTPVREIILKSIENTMYERMEVFDNEKEALGYDHRFALVINGTYDIEEDGSPVRLKVVGFDPAGVTLPAADAPIHVYIPDTVYGEVVLYDSNGDLVDADNAAASSWFYDVNSPYKFRVYECTNGNLTYIDNNAFTNCTSLDSIDLSQSVNLRYIGPGAFMNTGLTRVNLSYNAQIQSINNIVFANCANLERIVLPYADGKLTIAESAFSNDAALTTILMRQKAGEGFSDVEYLKFASVKANAFNNCSSLSELKLSTSTGVIVDGVFTGCRALTIYLDGKALPTTGWANGWNKLAFNTSNYLTVPYVLDTPGKTERNEMLVANDGKVYFVDEDTGLRFICEHGEDPDDLTSNVAVVTLQPTNLSGTVTIPSFIDHGGHTHMVREIGDSAFKDNQKITEVRVAAGNNLVTISQFAFAGCTALESFAFEVSDDNNHLTFVDATAFDNTPRLINPPQVSPNTSIDGFRYSLNVSTKNATVLEYVEDAEDVTIPATVEVRGNVYNVTAIDSNAFANKQLTSITLGKNVTSISAYAFVGCSNLAQINFAKDGNAGQLTNVSERAFSGCTALGKAYVTSGDMLFETTRAGFTAALIKYNGASYIDLTLPKSVLSFDENECAVDKVYSEAFSATSVSDEVVQQPVDNFIVSHDVKIVKHGDAGDEDDVISRVARNLYYMSDVTGLVYQLFDNEDGSMTATVLRFLEANLDGTELEVPVSVPFDGGKEYKVTAIGEGAFENSVNLDTVTIAGELESIGARAFKNCTSITDIMLPSSIKSIDPTAFEGCYALTITIDLPSTDESFGEGNVEWSAGCPVVYNDKGGVANDGYIYMVMSATEGGEDHNGLRIAYKANDDGSYEAIIARQASNFSGGEELTLPSSIKQARGAKVVAIAERAFENIVAYDAGTGVGINNVTIPSSVTRIGDYAFANSGLSNLLFEKDADEFDVINLIEIGEHAFENTPRSLFTYFVSGDYVYKMETSGARNAYIASYFGEELSGEVAFDETVTYLENEYTVNGVESGVFKDMTKIDSVVLPSTFAKIGNKAFAGCTSLAEIKFVGDVNSLTDVPEDAFADCAKLNVLYFTLANDEEKVVNVLFKLDRTPDENKGDEPKNVASVVRYVGFADPEVFIPNALTHNDTSYAVTEIEAGAFEGNTSIGKITIGTSITTINDRAFKNTNLTEFVIEGDVLDYNLSGIAPDAFEGSTRIAEVYIADGSALYKIDQAALTATVVKYYHIPIVGEDGSVQMAVEKHISYLGEQVTVTALGDHLFDHNKYHNIYGEYTVESIYLPNTVKIVGEYTFASDEETEEHAEIDIVFEDDIIGLEQVADTAFEGNSANVSFKHFDSHLYMLDKAAKTATLIRYIPGEGETEFMYAPNAGEYRVNRIYAYAFSLAPEITVLFEGSQDALIADDLDIDEGALTGHDVKVAGTDNNVIFTLDFEKGGLVSQGVYDPALMDREAISLTAAITLSGVRYSLVEIADYAFGGKVNLKTVKAASTLRRIGDGAFEGVGEGFTFEIVNVDKTEREFEYHLEDVSNSAFGELTLEKRYVTKDGFAYYVQGESATVVNYFGESSVVTMPQDIDGVNVTGIAYMAFANDAITEITITDKVTTIGKEALVGNDALLIKLSFAAGVEKETVLKAWGEGWNCGYPYEIDGAYSDGKQYLVQDGVLYLLTDDESGTYATALKQSASLGGVVNIPESVQQGEKVYAVTTIAQNAFEGNALITQITLSSSVKSVENHAFANMSAIERISIGSLEIAIGEGAFANSSVTSVAFENESATKITIGAGAFEGADRLASVTFANEQAIEELNDAFKGLDLETIWATVEKGLYRLGRAGFATLVKYAAAEEETALTLSDVNYDGKQYELREIITAGIPESVTTVTVKNDLHFVGDKKFDLYYETAEYTFFFEGEGATLTSALETDDVVIPASVTFDGKVYGVTTVADNVLTSAQSSVTFYADTKAALSQCGEGVKIFYVYNYIKYELNVTNNTATLSAIEGTEREYVAGDVTFNEQEYKLSAIGEGLKGATVGELSIAVSGESFSLAAGALEGFSANTLTINATALTIISGAFGGANIANLVLATPSMSVEDGSVSVADGAFEGAKVGVIAIIAKQASVSENAFKNNETLSMIIIIAHTTTIATGAFEGASALSAVYVMDSVPESEAFDAWQLKDGSSITIESGAFKDSAISNLVLLASAVDVKGAAEGGAFAGCVTLAQITITAHDLKIGEKAFADSAEAYLTLANEMEKDGLRSLEMAQDAFGDRMPGGYYYDAENRVLYKLFTLEDVENVAYLVKYFKKEAYDVAGSVSVKETEYSLYVYPSAFDESVTLTVHSDTRFIGELTEGMNLVYEEDGYSYELTVVGVEDSLARLTSVAKEGESVDAFIPASITFDNYEFKVTSVAQGAFEGVTLASVTVEDELTFEGGVPEGAKFFVSLEGVKYQLIETEGVFTATLAGFTDPADERETITILNEISYGKNVYAVTKIGERAFEGNAFIKYINLNANLTEIGAGAFKNTTNLNMFTYAADEEGGTINNLEVIAEDAFEGSNIQEGNIPRTKFQVDEPVEDGPAEDEPAEDDPAGE